VSWFNDFIGRFSQETKPRPQKLANIIDRLTPALGCWTYDQKVTSLTTAQIAINGYHMDG